MTDSIVGITPDSLRGKARAVLSLAVERMEQALSDASTEFTLPELSQSIGALGRIGLGDTTNGSGQGDIRITIVRDTLPNPNEAIGLAQPIPYTLANVPERDDLHEQGQLEPPHPEG